jgi:hypothetical protein
MEDNPFRLKPSLESLSELSDSFQLMLRKSYFHFIANLMFKEVLLFSRQIDQESTTA